MLDKTKILVLPKVIKRVYFSMQPRNLTQHPYLEFKVEKITLWSTHYQSFKKVKIAWKLFDWVSNRIEGLFFCLG